MDDNTIVKTENATQSWNETTDWDGSNHIGRASGSQWHQQILHRSRKGRYYIEYISSVSGEQYQAEWVGSREAARWLLHNDIELPSDLTKSAEEVSE
jgi:Tfp pilus assembly protein PilX